MKTIFAVMIALLTRRDARLIVWCHLIKFRRTLGACTVVSLLGFVVFLIPMHNRQTVKTQPAPYYAELIYRTPTSGGGIACDYGPNTTVGTDLTTAGFTHCVLNADFTDK